MTITNLSVQLVNGVLNILFRIKLNNGARNMYVIKLEEHW